MTMKFFSEKAWDCGLNANDTTEEIGGWRVSRLCIRPPTPSFVMPFISQAKCILAFISHLST